MENNKELYKVLFRGAIVRKDGIEGMVFRGWCIVENWWERYYLTKTGEWTYGIVSRQNWWPSEATARSALEKLSKQFYQSNQKE